MRPIIRLILIQVIIVALLITGCTKMNPEKARKLNCKPEIDPAYAGVTIPPNIAPLNFSILEDGDFFRIIVYSPSNKMELSLTSSEGIVRFPEKSWKKLLGRNKGNKIKIQIISSREKGGENILEQFDLIYLHVASEPIDPYLIYRLLYPGYISWSDMKIVQRSLETFREKSLIENQILENNCVNCHSFNQNEPDEFLIHIRGSKGGTYFASNDELIRTALRVENMPGGATYPTWHPGGRYVAFSSNRVKQRFYAHARKCIEVYDEASALVLYDIKKNEMIYIKEDSNIPYMQTFPSWSPDGRYLYFCVVKQTEENYSVKNLKDIHYDLARKSFDSESGTFGDTEIVFNASEIKKSVSFPRISPDGQYLIFTLHDYGTFPIWHKEADLYLLNLKTGENKKMRLNSDDTESYHSWSSNSKWIVFSSKRRDGRSARPYFAYIGQEEVGKPFVLPRKDPTQYQRMLKTFNIPELVKGKIKFNPKDFSRSANKKSLKTKMVNPEDIPSQLRIMTEKENAGTEWEREQGIPH